VKCVPAALDSAVYKHGINQQDEVMKSLAVQVECKREPPPPYDDYYRPVTSGPG